MAEQFLEQKIIDFRRYLHRIPELGYDLHKTRSFLLSILKPLNCEIKDLGKGGFTAYFSCGFGSSGASDTIAFRSDMDAIPITEPKGCGFRSENEGAMHACGHDGHMGMLLGLAIWIAEHREKLPVNCLLVFQAAEETIGGAKMIAATGVLRQYNVSRIYGIHLWPGYPRNTVICRPREFMAGTFVMNVTLQGRSSHIAEYEESVDALEVGCNFILQTYAFEKSLPKDIRRLIRFGRFVSGTAGNVVSDKTLISGAIRAFDDETFELIETGIAEIIQKLEHETGIKISYTKSEGYLPVINPPNLNDETRKTLTNMGFTWFEPLEPIMQAEDFSYYQHEVPGLFMFLGTGEGARLHSPDYTLDESVLITGVQLMQSLIISERSQK